MSKNIHLSIISPIYKSLETIDYLEYITDIRVGELLVTYVDKEGTWSGYDLELMNYVNSKVEIPVIANEGCGSVKHIKEVLFKSETQAAALGSMVVYQKKIWVF